MIGKDITVMVTNIEGNRVQLGIDAPKNLRVDREEVWEIRQEQR